MYGQLKLALKRHMKALFELEPVRVENARAPENLLDSATRHVSSLEAIGQVVGSWNLF